MQFNDTTNESGIVQEIKFELGLGNDTNNTIYTLKDIARHSNRALDEVYGIIMAADQTWQFDDTNYTDMSIATTDLNLNQRDYEFDADHLKVQRVEIKDSDGNWKRLQPRDYVRDDRLEGMDDAQDPAGIPKYFDVQGTQLFVFPKASFTVEGGLKVWFQRKADYFVSTDTTKEPGFAKIYHEYIPLFCSHRFASSRSTDQAMRAKAADLRGRMNTMQMAMTGFYSQRNEFKDRKIAPKYKSPL